MSRLRDLLLSASAALAPPPSGMPDVGRSYQGWPFPESLAQLEYPRAVKLVPTIYAIVNRVASDVASVSPSFYRLGRDGSEILIERQSGNITDVWAKANPEQSSYELTMDYQSSLDANGNAYLYLERFGKKGPPQELYSIPGHLLTPAPGPRRTIAWYEYRNADGNQRVAASDVLPIRYWNANVNPDEPWPMGMSPLSAARSGFQTRYTMGQWQQKLFERGGQTNLILSVKDGNAASREDVRQWQEEMDARFSGLKNAFKPIFLRGVDVVRAGMTLDEMNFIEQAKLSDADICHVYGMHPILMGFTESTSSGIQYKDALLDHWMSCIGSRVRLRDAVLTERLCPLFARGSDTIICKTDLSGVLPLQGARLELAKGVVIITGQPSLTPNEGREVLGVPPSDDPQADEIHWKTGGGALNAGEEGPVPVGDEATNPKPATGEAVVEPKPEGKKEAQPVAAARVAASADTDVLSARRKRADANLRRAERRTEEWARGPLARYAESVDRQLREQAAAQGVSLELGAARVKLEADPERLVFSPDPEDLERAQALFESLVLERGTEMAADAGVEVSFQHVRERIARYAEEKARFALTSVTETTARDVRDAIVRALREGASWNDVIGAVRGYFSDAQQYRPALIARTETTGAYNFGALEGLAAARVERKYWITVGDDAVRESHLGAEAEGPIPLDARFSNGLLFPGDPAGPVGEIANCRCVLEGEFELEDGERTEYRRTGNAWGALFGVGST